MNYSTSVMLINEDIIAVSTLYTPDPEKGAKGPRTIFKTLDKSIKSGDFVVVPTSSRHYMTVVKVDEVGVDVDFEDPEVVDWIIARVDATAADKIKTLEQVWIEKLKQSEKKHQKNELRKKLLGSTEADIDLSKLAISNLTDVTALEHKPVPVPPDTGI